MNDRRPWHRLFDLSWMDYLQGTSIGVEAELDLSQKQQFLDLLLTWSGEALVRPLPDGFDNLGRYNLVTFKSYQEALDFWALCELVGHYVNVRKQLAPTRDELPAASDFRLYAVCVRFPRGLSGELELTLLRPGVYAVHWGPLTIRVIVVQELPEEEPNALLHLFSANVRLLRYGQQHYRPRSLESSTLLVQLLLGYMGDENMANKLQEFVHESITELLRTLPPEKRLEGLSAEERLKGLPAEKRLEGLPAEKRLEGLPAEKRLEGLPAEKRLEGLSPEERLQGLSREELRALLEAAQRRLQV